MPEGRGFRAKGSVQMTDLNSRPYRPSKHHCCERCVFGTGKHAEFCERKRIHDRTEPPIWRVSELVCNNAALKAL